MIGLIPVAEIFGPTTQGEGRHSGLKVMFVRVAYCDGAGATGWCSWCDTIYAVDPSKYKHEWQLLTPQDIIAALYNQNSPCKDVVISGGNPVLHDLADLVRELHKDHYRIHVETQGTMYRPWLNDANFVTVSPKPPSAGACNLARLEKFLEQLQDNVCFESALKIVVDPLTPDMDFAREVVVRFRDYVDYVYFSTLTRPTDTLEQLTERWRQLTSQVLADDSLQDVYVGVQQHVLQWGHRRGI